MEHLIIFIDNIHPCKLHVISHLMVLVFYLVLYK